MSDQKKVQCRCGARVDELTSYFGIPLPRVRTEFRVCPSWSGLSR